MSNLNIYNIVERKRNPYENISTETLRDAIDYLMSVKIQPPEIFLEIWEIRRVIANRIEKGETN